MTVTIKHPDGLVHVEKLETGENRISVESVNDKLFIPRSTWKTSYSLNLIEQILDIKGPAWLCDEIMRDEDPTYIQNYIKYAVLSYVKEKDFNGKVILDIGCGCGASTMVLGRMFPNAEKVGVELVDDFVSVAKLRAKHYRFDNISFFVSPEGSNLPDGLGDFDYVFLNAVYEHLLPNERNVLLPKIWSHLKPSGIIFINETPHRYFPIESHTTGLPLINYLPNKITLYLARRLSKRVQPEESWETLLRMGIRGGTVKEIMRILNRTSQRPILLKPERLGIQDQSDIWYKASSARRLPATKRLMIFSMRIFKRITGIPLTPYLSLAIQKEY